MYETYTSQDALIQLMYHELPLADAFEMTEMLEDNPQMRSMYSEMLYAHKQLPKVQFTPSKSVLSNILSYSTNTAMEARF
jgi:hypothetical protein